MELLLQGSIDSSAPAEVTALVDEATYTYSCDVSQSIHFDIMFLLPDSESAQTVMIVLDDNVWTWT